MPTRSVVSSDTIASFSNPSSADPLASRARGIQQFAEPRITTEEALDSRNLTDPEQRQHMRECFQTADVLSAVSQQQGMNKAIEVHAYIKEHGLEATYRKYNIRVLGS